MHGMSARDAKNGFGRLIDLARADPVAVEKYGRAVVVVLAVEEYERLTRKGEKHSAAETAKRERSGKRYAKNNRAVSPTGRTGVTWRTIPTLPI